MADVQRGAAGVRPELQRLAVCTPQQIENSLRESTRLPDWPWKLDLVKKRAAELREHEAARSGAQAGSVMETRFLQIFGPESATRLTKSMKDAVAEVDEARRKSEARA